MARLNVVALISGGKDSLFSILHCQANSHKVVALANLYPQKADRPVEDIESYMYQTIGHAVVPLYEQALGLPLYRQEINGDAVNQDKTYRLSNSDAPPDETESLLAVLQQVLKSHPEINAVSTGAILSDYQRTRVESVATRLGLIPLSYLWQWPALPPHTPTSLLENMLAVGQDARIIKVASGGLDDSFLWQNVADSRTITRLSKAAARFGTPGDGAVLGEGGEYETLAVNGPASLWKGRIVVPEAGIQVIPGEAGSASLRISEPSVVMHAADAPHIGHLDLPVPPLLEPRFQDILDGNGHHTPYHGEAPLKHLDIEPQRSRNVGNAIILSDLDGKGMNAAEQTRSIMDEIISQLKAASLDPRDIAYTIIVLRDMRDFAAVNAVYASYFVNPNPPARLTIACANVLREEALLTISIVGAPGPREGLHVQSRSYWAPANIGPYSQALKFPPSTGSEATGDSIFIAGQIPLVPATMEFPKHMAVGEGSGFKLQVVLALQHLSRIGCAMEVKQWIFGICFLAKPLVAPSLSDRARIARFTWKAFHNRLKSPESTVDVEGEDFDVWDLQNGSRNRPWSMQVSSREEVTWSTKSGLPRLAVIGVDTLPRGSEVEWYGFGGGERMTYSSTPDHLQQLLRVFRHHLVSDNGEK